eukprot:284144_1
MSIKSSYRVLRNHNNPTEIVQLSYRKTRNHQAKKKHISRKLRRHKIDKLKLKKSHLNIKPFPYEEIDLNQPWPSSYQVLIKGQTDRNNEILDANKRSPCNYYTYRLGPGENIFEVNRYGKYITWYRLIYMG